ncbi:MAG: hypothetical protein FWD35_05065 [Oscillospiraceae bacterium]|nr:hypothetical protein [Oscillospiraceae bacterium]
MHQLSEETKASFKKIVGLEYEEILAMSHDEIMAYQKAKIPGLGFSKVRKKGRYGRGNPLLARRKIRTFEDLDRIFEGLKRIK